MLWRKLSFVIPVSSFYMCFEFSMHILHHIKKKKKKMLKPIKWISILFQTNKQNLAASTYYSKQITKSWFDFKWALSIQQVTKNTRNEQNHCLTFISFFSYTREMEMKMMLKYFQLYHPFADWICSNSYSICLHQSVSIVTNYETWIWWKTTIYHDKKYKRNFHEQREWTIYESII